MKNFKLQNKIIIKITLIIGIISIVLICSSAIIIYKSNLKTLNTITYETLSMTSIAVEKALDVMKSNVQNVAALETIKDPTATKEQKLNLITQLRDEYGYDEIGFVNLNGSGYSNYGDFDFNDQIHFQNAKEGKLFVGEPIVNRLNGKVIVISAAPVYNNDNIVATVFIVDNIENINNLIARIKFGETGLAYVVNSEGKILYHKDMQIIADGFNAIELAKTDKEYSSMAKATQKIVSGDKGITEFMYKKQKMYLAYSPIEEYDSWSIVMVAPKSEFTLPVVLSILINLILAVILLGISYIVTISISKSIAKPIQTVTERLRKLSEGNLSDKVEVIDSRDELGILSKSLYETIKSLNYYISDIKQNLGEIANGNIVINLTADFKGDFVSIKDSIYKISDYLNVTLNEIEESARSVADTSAQVETAAHSLAQGATEQASEVLKLSTTIDEISKRIKSTADNITTVREKSVYEDKLLSDFSKQISDLITSMHEMNTSSKEIEKIIKVIEDIAFQTNILALNAAIEAARAGTAGKGFSIVADEVRNLAGKSSKAAKDTTVLIQNSIDAIENGAMITTNVAESLNTILSNEQYMIEIIDNINQSANEQASSIGEVNTGMGQINIVVQTNSATAEQSAAASQTLLTQAQALKKLVDNFNFDKSANTNDYININNNTTDDIKVNMENLDTDDLVYNNYHDNESLSKY